MVQRLAQLCRTLLGGAGTCHHDQIDASQLLLIMTKGFSYNPLKAVALDGKTEMFFGGNETESGCGAIRGSLGQDQKGVMADFGVDVVEYLRVIRGIQQTLLTFERK